MARAPVIGRDDMRIRVVEAVVAIQQVAQVPTVSRVRDWLATNYGHAGAQDILQAAVREVVAEVALAEDGARPVLPMPSDVEALAAASVRTLWRKAAQSASAEYEMRRTAGERDLADALAARELAERQFTEVERERDRLEDGLAQARSVIAGLETKLAAAEARAEEQGRKFEAVEGELRRQIDLERARGAAMDEVIQQVSAKVDVLMSAAPTSASAERTREGTY